MTVPLLLSVQFTVVVSEYADLSQRGQNVLHLRDVGTGLQSRNLLGDAQC